MKPCQYSHWCSNYKRKDFVEADHFCPLDANEKCEIPEKPVKNKPEQVNHPSHYGGEKNVYEVIKVIEAWGVGFHLGNAIKYIARAGKKNTGTTVEDLKKAKWYIERMISQEEAQHGEDDKNKERGSSC